MFNLHRNGAADLLKKNLTFYMDGGELGIIEVPTTVHYYPVLAPAEIEMVFDHKGVHKSWTFHRNLLIDAIEYGSAGLGDVRVSVVEDNLYIGLVVQGESAILYIPVPVIAMICDEMLAAVPYNQEEYSYDLDKELSQLLESQ